MKMNEWNGSDKVSENAIVVVWMSGWKEDDKVVDIVVDEDWME